MRAASARTARSFAPASTSRRSSTCESAPGASSSSKKLLLSSTLLTSCVIVQHLGDAVLRAAGERRARRSARRALRLTSATVPSSTFSPRAMMHTESHIFSALSMTCVLKMTVLPRALELEHRVLQRLRVDRIESAERLVENHEIGIVQQRRDELHLLLHAARQLVDLGVAPVLVAGREAEARRATRRCAWSPPSAVTPFSSARNSRTRRTCIFLYRPRSSGR